MHQKLVLFALLAGPIAALRAALLAWPFLVLLLAGREPK
jgi:hypothetical protein